MKYAVYSEKQKELAGSVIWARRDGSEVEITEVSDQGYPACLWDDKEDRGEVVRYVRRKLRARIRR